MKLSQVKRNLPEEARTLIALVGQLREKQRLFFKFKEDATLKACKGLEQELDRFLETFKEPENTLQVPIKKLRAEYTMLHLSSEVDTAHTEVSNSSLVEYSSTVIASDEAMLKAAEQIKLKNYPLRLKSITINKIEEVQNESH
jgi:hypothetical protein